MEDARNIRRSLLFSCLAMFRDCCFFGRASRKGDSGHFDARDLDLCKRLVFLEGQQLQKECGMEYCTHTVLDDKVDLEILVCHIG